MYWEPFTKKQLNDIYNEFNATEDTVQRDVDHLKEWLQSQPHLPNIQDDNWLANILQRCKFKMDKTKAQLDYYYTSKVEMAYLFEDRDPRADEIKKALNVMSTVPARSLTSEGYRIAFTKIFQHSKEDLPSPDSLLRTFQIQFDILTKEDRARGMIVLVDFEHISFPFFTLSLSIIRRSLTMTTKLNKVRLHKIYFLHCTPSVEILLKIAKSIVSKDLAKRFEVWEKEPSQLAEVLPSHIVPSNYGGEERSMEELKDQWYHYLTTFHEWFAEQENVKADLSKKPKTDGVASRIKSMLWTS